MSLTLTPDAMRAKFEDLTREKEGIQSQSAPLRAQMDALTAVIEQKKGEVRTIFQQVKQIEARLYDIDMERAALARALGGKSMSRAPATPQPNADGSNVIVFERLRELETKAKADAEEMARIKAFLSEFKTNIEQA